eukprot:6017001-Alexandrium_andersonii.AAC.1
MLLDETVQGHAGSARAAAWGSWGWSRSRSWPMDWSKRPRSSSMEALKSTCALPGPPSPSGRLSPEP